MTWSSVAWTIELSIYRGNVWLCKRIAAYKPRYETQWWKDSDELLPKLLSATKVTHWTALDAAGKKPIDYFGEVKGIDYEIKTTMQELSAGFVLPLEPIKPPTLRTEPFKCCFISYTYVRNNKKFREIFVLFYFTIFILLYNILLYFTFFYSACINAENYSKRAS